MNAMTRTEENEIQTARIRMLQAFHFEAHQALTQWGLWSMDRRGIYPTLSQPGMWDQFKRDGTEAYGDEANAVVVAAVGPAKAERPDHEDYDEKLAVRLDELMHGAGGLAEYVRRCVKTAYATREVPEYQFPLFSNCSTLDQFCERLEAGLRFVARFA
jgi:hypothetical protein